MRAVLCGVDNQLPTPPAWQLGKGEVQVLVMHVEGGVQKLSGAAQRMVVLAANHERQRVAVFRPIGFVRLHSVPGNIGVAAADAIPAGKPLTAVKRAMTVAESNQHFDKAI